jgi:hypothetical protein
LVFELQKQLDLSDDYIKVLTECDLKTKLKVDKCVKAANVLLKTIDSDIPTGLTKMKAFEEQKKFLENLKFKFGLACATHIKNAIGLAVNKHLESYVLNENSLKELPSHNIIHTELYQFKDLIPWLAQSGVFFNDHNRAKFHYEDVKSVSSLDILLPVPVTVFKFDSFSHSFKFYIETVKGIYSREILAFFNCARSTIFKMEKPKGSKSKAKHFLFLNHK